MFLKLPRGLAFDQYCSARAIAHETCAGRKLAPGEVLELRETAEAEHSRP